MGYDHVMFSLTALFLQYCKFVDRNGVLKPSVRQASQLVFDYKADALGTVFCPVYSNIFIKYYDICLLIYSSGMISFTLFYQLIPYPSSTNN